MVTVNDENGRLVDITDKEKMEKAIMKNNKSKFKQAHHRPFYKFPLINEFGNKGLTIASTAALAGYMTPTGKSRHTRKN